MKNRGDKKRILFYAINGALIAVSIVFLLAVHHNAGILQAQLAAERWQGENETRFSQISCFLPTDSSFDLEEVGAFRNSAASKLHEAALDLNSEEKMFVDAWSCTGEVKASSNLGSGDASVIAVGGNYFDFHPITLLNGNYISPTDVMQDRVLLDEDLAWLLFGGMELQGLSMEIDGKPFVVAGVIEREQDFASEKAYTAGMGLYMSYDAYKLIDEDCSISCYELVMPEPLNGFAMNTVSELFPVKEAEIINNSTRFEWTKLLRALRQFSVRSMQTKDIAYPYWENAARYMENICALFLLIVIAAAFIPAVTAAVFVIRLILRGKRGLQENVLPKLRENAQEAVRVRQRRRWEKKHGIHEG